MAKVPYNRCADGHAYTTYVVLKQKMYGVQEPVEVPVKKSKASIDAAIAAIKGRK